MQFLIVWLIGQKHNILCLIARG